jgi:hypothetical protein
MSFRGQRSPLRSTLTCLAAFLTFAPIVAATESVQSGHKTSATAQKSTVPIRDLTVAQTVSLSVPPPQMLIPKTKCDEKGDIYVVQSGGRPLGVQNGLSLIPVQELLIGSKSTVSYPVPKLDRYRGVVRLDFDVSADGHLYALLEAVDASPSSSDAQPSFFIARYRNDGTMESHFNLEDAPDRHIQPFHFAMFRDGRVFVTGTAVAEGKPLRSFAAVLDRSGRFVKYVQASNDEEVAMKALENRISEKKKGTAPSEVESTAPESDVALELSSSSLIVGAPDGNVYLLRGTDQLWLYVISPAGELVRRFQIPQPASGLSPTNIGLAGENGIFIAFEIVQGRYQPKENSADPKGPDKLISVISSQTGDVIAVYRLPAAADAFEVPGCAASSDSFLFLGATADGQYQQVTKYSAR